MQPHYGDILPHLDGYLKTAAGGKCGSTFGRQAALSCDAMGTQFCCLRLDMEMSNCKVEHKLVAFGPLCHFGLWSFPCTHLSVPIYFWLSGNSKKRGSHHRINAQV